MVAMQEQLQQEPNGSAPAEIPAGPSGPAASTVASTTTPAANQPAVPSATQVNWGLLVDRIKGGDESGMEELYRIFAKGIRFFLCRQLGPQELDDKVHDTFLIVVNAIKRGDLREPERLMGFVRTVVRRQVAAYIDQVVHSRREELDVELGGRVPDRRDNPEQKMASRQKIELMQSVLRELSENDREILTRFYLHEQTQEQICEDMQLSDTQFRLLKSRAKARFGELGKKKLNQKALISVFMRTSVGITN
ncbi:MAG: sigma-70 family RNA polymerase sigma factor [Acidobacteriota bacterium]|nr:sigma-70 family RNA polymerase sigma factor [Acidobacteriota bacterium]